MRAVHTVRRLGIGTALSLVSTMAKKVLAKRTVIVLALQCVDVVLARRCVQVVLALRYRHDVLARRHVCVVLPRRCVALTRRRAGLAGWVGSLGRLGGNAAASHGQRNESQGNERRRG
jgi:hypothetical protein